MGLGKTPDRAGPPRPHRRRRPGARDRPAGRGRATGPRRPRASRPALQVRRAPRRRTAPTPTSSPARSPAPTSSSPPTPPPCATSTRSPQIEWSRVVLDEAQAIKNPTNDTAQQLRRIHARTRLALTGTPIENGLGDLWAILDFTNPGLVGAAAAVRRAAVGRRRRRRAGGAARAQRHPACSAAPRAEPEIAAELPDQIDELDHCTMTPEQIGLYQAVLDDARRRRGRPRGRRRRARARSSPPSPRSKQICNHPVGATSDDDRPLAGRSGKLARLEEIVESVFAAGERVLVFTHFATWGRRLAEHLTEVTGIADRVLRRRPHPRRPRPDHRRLPERRRARARWCCR